MLMKISWKIMRKLQDNKGMEMIQVAILIGIAVAIGIVFNDKIITFVNDIFSGLDNANFS